MDITGLEIWLILQAIVECALIAFMILFFRKLKQSMNSKSLTMEKPAGNLEHLMAESEKISAYFADNLKQKKELSLNLLLKLERKINEMRQLLETSEAALARAPGKGKIRVSPGKNNPAAPETQTLVLKLASKGLDVEAIARQARLHHGEVELILDLGKRFSPEHGREEVR